MLYNIFCGLALKVAYSNEKTNNITRKETTVISSLLVFMPANIIVISLFIGLFVTLTFNIYTGLLFVVFSFVCTIASFYIIKKKLASIIKKDYIKSSNLLLSLFIFFLIVLNPLIYISFIPLRLEIVDFVLVSNKDMSPTLLSRNLVVVDKISGLVKKPQKDDLLYLESPIRPGQIDLPFKTLFKDIKNNDLVYIRRLLAKNGDTIEINREKGILLNKTKIEEKYIKEPDNNIICTMARHCEEKTISRNYYYVLGDNRNACQDSRIWSEVDKKFIKGKIHSVIWPKNNFKIF